METREIILEGRTSLGVEFGSTRIKAVLIDENGTPLASGSYQWENQYVDGVWTYDIDLVWKGLQACYQDLLADVKKQYDVEITKLGSIGFSAMMHGYIALDKDDKLLVPFRTWRNTMTEEASVKLTEEFHYNIPQRWSIAHLYQAILNQEAHVKDIAFLTTLAGYVHYKLTGKKVLGVGDASGMFPIDIQTGNYDKKMIDRFHQLIAGENLGWQLEDILPQVMTAGEEAGSLTQEGAALLDVSGKLEAGIPMCPPEGDAGTGMAATNSVGKRTGNLSAGTSVFAMIVLEKELAGVYPEIDLVTTPDGALVGMVHCNNCTSDLNAWVGLFAEFAESMGIEADQNKLFTTLFNKAMEGDADCGGMISYNYFSGEPVTGFDKGAPLFVRKAGSELHLSDFMRTHLYSSLATLKIGLDLMFRKEDVKVDRMYGHGGFFKTKGVGQKIAAAAMNTPVSVMETAGEGGAWGIALLAGYMYDKTRKGNKENLQDFLDHRIFAGQTGSSVEPDPKDVEGFNKFMTLYTAGLSMERAAVETMESE